MTKIKICGITNLNDALAIAKLDVDYLGFIINFPCSLRNMAVEEVNNIIQKIKTINNEIKFVGVFVNEKMAVINDIVHICDLDIAQLHGQETSADCQKLSAGIEVWKTVIIKNKKNISEVEKYRDCANKILFDSGSGSGRKINYELLANTKVDVLAGGLGYDNVAKAINKLRPEIVDLNSQLESLPGKKDINLVKKAVNIIKNM